MILVLKAFKDPLFKSSLRTMKLETVRTHRFLQSDSLLCEMTQTLAAFLCLVVLVAELSFVQLVSLLLVLESLSELALARIGPSH